MRKSCAITLALLLLSACEGQNARDILGLGKRTPDEFRVVSRPPLSVPPDFSLRPPQKEGTISGRSEGEARALVTGGDAEATSGYDAGRFMGPAETAVGVVERYDLESNADSQFLSNLGAAKADPTIREKLSEEREERSTVKQEEKNDYLFDWLVPSTGDDVTVDAKAEKERLEKNKAQDKPVTEGDTPLVEPKQKGVLEDLL